MSIRTRALSAVAALALTLSPFAFCFAQEIQWRTDYQTARREAAARGLPLVIDLGTRNCFYCKQLDATTFRDPAIVNLLNEQCVPLKLDEGSDPSQLSAKLGVKGFPTLVFAGSEGKILSVQTGYVAAAPMQELLQQLLVVAGAPEWMDRDYRLAAQAVAATEYGRAITLLKSVTQDGKQRPIQLKARQLLKDLEGQAAVELARARQLVDKGQKMEALETTNEVLRVFPGTEAAVEARRMATGLTVVEEIQAPARGRQAQDLLVQAQQDFQAQRYLACLSHCETLGSIYGDTPEAAAAGKLANEIKNNPESMRQACDCLSEQLGLMYLTLAETWVRKGQPQQAALCLERIIQTFPGSQQAEMAQVRWPDPGPAGPTDGVPEALKASGKGRHACSVE